MGLNQLKMTSFRSLEMSPSLKFLLFISALSTTLILFKLSQDEKWVFSKKYSSQIHRGNLFRESITDTMLVEDPSKREHVNESIISHGRLRSHTSQIVSLPSELRPVKL